MPSLPGVNHQDAIRALGRRGFVVIRQGKHVILSDGTVRIVLPRANPVNALTMGSIARQAGLTPAQFRALL